ncbi:MULTISPECIES: methyl-accepting chemotaxis protein [Rhizobium/Agrobacterium group]|uniref:methyl-accepting chemotaxis protein n=1 Tax=Rhizobium/Agrobacterium group TaxID=227290 RepID=UPI0012E79518|nr:MULTISPECIES: methyl-accepting chemotaxis protein [Rhizobium/Agrobacterium group]MCF1475330.1 HAMP domain-containing protein [Allorhizobium ampelinum]MVA73460.1 HAMP domain-containing protein [Agrobacterium vitis]NSZ19577.1 HAMP domain-containing protein [Agrobacterium vitis]QZO07311.1 HAMP domain-containing protein [Agrobacterium vitis]UJL91074.1 HAMP domain-containing protein [Agrobacterium vitis]
MSDHTVRRPLWIQITGYGFAAVMFASAAIGGLAWHAQSTMNDTAVKSKTASDLAVIRAEMAAISRSAAALASSVANDPGTVQMIANGDREGLLTKYQPGMAAVAKEGALQTFTFLDVTGTVVARSHSPAKFGDMIIGRRQTVASAINTGKLSAGIEQGRTAINTSATAPVIRDGKVIGAIDVGTELSNAFFGPIADRLGAEIAVDVLVEGKVQTQASTQGDKSILAEEQIRAALDGKPVTAGVTLDGRDMIINAIPFNNFGGAKLGVIELATDATTILADGRQSTLNSIGASVLVSLLSLFGFLFFARALGGAISRLTGTMTRLATGDLSASVEGGRRPDEIGAMARAVDVFKENSLKARELERQAEENRSLSEEQRQRSAEQERSRSQAMAEATSGLATGLKHLSEGDLTYQLDRAFVADFEPLRADFNAAVSQLRGTLISFAQATSSIDSGSREVSQSADDLAKRTEQQAASLEETAAALDQITVNVASSSKRTEDARTVAIQANESARHSGAVVANAVDAMGRIEQSSGQISNIIGVIDDIAFQTNLLALNAGVEAARAGEAGKGFAVVAQEVRELAQRSAKAAKEIKDLIGKSSVEVGTGVKLVSETGDALRKIETYIVTINQHMDAIATSSREQSVGLAEVNTAVNQMDQVTQQNAAMVEEANAAGATLANEAGRLRELISQFQLGHEHAVSRQDPAPRRAAPVTAVSGRPWASASARSVPADSPARGMVSKIAKAFGGGQSRVAAAPSTDSWEEF